jgi:hypothetical protein
MQVSRVTRRGLAYYIAPAGTGDIATTRSTPRRIVFRPERAPLLLHPRVLA